VDSDGVNAATTAKGESDKHLPQWGTGTPHAMTRRGDNDTSVLNASPHWTARYKNGESADLTVEIRLVCIMSLFTKSGLTIRIRYSRLCPCTAKKGGRAIGAAFAKQKC